MHAYAILWIIFVVFCFQAMTTDIQLQSSVGILSIRIQL